MLRVTIDLISALDKSLDRRFFQLDICNTCSGSPTSGNYRITVYKHPNIILKRIHFSNFKRQKYNALWLLYNVLKTLFNEKGGSKLKSLD